MMNRKMLKQAQQLQKRMEQMQEEMETLTVEGSAGGGAVTATVTGKMHVLSITIDPDVVDPTTSSYFKTWCLRPSTTACAERRRR